VIYDLAFPKKVDEVTITENEMRVYQGWFSVEGSFIRATTWDETSAHNYQLLSLSALGRSVVIEQASAPIENGETGAFSPVPILPQIDLLSAYQEAIDQEALANPYRARKRGALLSEAISWLQAESLPLARTHLGSGELDDMVRAEVLVALCKSNSDWATEELLSLAGQAPGPQLSRSALQCGRMSKSPHRPDFHRVGLEDFCARGSESPFELSDLKLEDGLSPAEADGVVGACDNPVRRTLLTIGLDRQPSDEDLSALLASDEPLVLDGNVLAWLNTACRPHRAAVFSGLKSHPGTEVYLRKILEAPVDISGPESEVLARNLVQTKTGVLKLSSEAPILVSLLYKAREVGAATSDAVAVLEAGLSQDAGNKNLLAGLVALGEHQHSPWMLRSLRAVATTDLDPSVHLEPVGMVMALHGCTVEEQNSALKAAILRRSKATPECLSRPVIGRDYRPPYDTPGCAEPD
jgi:hypothetical protein